MKLYRNRSLFAGLLLSSALGGLVGSAHAAAVEGYLQDTSGAVVRSGRGECWHTSRWDAATASAECDGTPVAKAEPQPEAPKVTPQPEPKPVPATPVRTVKRVTLQSDTYFAFNSAQLSEEGERKLDEMAQSLKDARDVRIQVTGYTDPIGSDRYNLKLSQNRAQAVKGYLVKKGVAGEAIAAEGKGETNLVAACPGTRGAAQIKCFGPNRRTEVEISAVKAGE